MKYIRIFGEFFIFFSMCFNCNAHAINSDTFYVSLRDIPKTIDIRRSNSNIEMYIAHQIYYPLLTLNQTGHFESFFLDLEKTRANNEDFSEFSFCLKQELKFSDGSPVSLEDLKRSLEEFVSAEFSRLFKNSRINGNCVLIFLNKPSFNFLHRFLTVHSTITKSSQVNGPAATGYPLGVGPYMVESSSHKKLTLRRREPTSSKNGFKKVEISLYSDQTNLNDLDDPNHIYQIDPDKILGEKFTSYALPTEKIYGLYNSVVDPNLRTAISACIDKEQLAQAIPSKTIRTNQIIPAGYLGHSSEPLNGSPMLLSCDDALRKIRNKKVSIKFIDPTGNLNLKKFAADLSMRSKIKVKYLNLSAEVSRKMIYGKEQVLFLCGLAPESHSTSGNKDSAWAFSVLKSLPFSIHNASQVLSSIKEESKDEVLDTHFRKLEILLLESGAFVPVARTVSHQFYSKKIKSFRYSSLGAGIIDISSAAQEEK